MLESSFCKGYSGENLFLDISSYSMMIQSVAFQSTWTKLVSIHMNVMDEKGVRTSVEQLGSEAVLSVTALLGAGYMAWLKHCVYAF